MSKTTKRRAATQADVAQLAGVSRPMVSYVLNNLSSVQVAAETRQKILDAIETLGYVPDRIAQSLRTRKTYIIANVIPDITNPFYPALQRGVQDVAKGFKYSVIAYNTDGNSEDEAMALEWAQEGMVDGLIGTFFHTPIESFNNVLKHNTFVVYMGAEPIPEGDMPIDRTYVDNAAAACTAVNYLIDKGHRRIAMISGQMSTPPRERRVAGYRQALSDHAITLDEMLVIGSDFTERGGYEAMQAILALAERPTAVFGANDLIAIGAMLAIRDAGLNIPDDIAVVGMDNIPAARLVHPALTTIDQFPEQSGKKATEMLFERLNGQFVGGVRNHEMPFELLIRDSA